MTTLIANRAYSTFLPAQSNENPALSFYDLDYLSLIHIRGDKAGEFLQGQVTADIHEVNAKTMRQAALCNLKGRVKVLMDIIFWQDGYQIILPSDLVQETFKSLSMAANLARVTVEVDSQIQITGIVRHENDAAFTHPLPLTRYGAEPFAESFSYKIGDNAFILLSNQNEQLPLKGSFFWHQYQLAHKKIEIYPESAGLFLPHRLDLQLDGYINFQKGCYKGQEIIARMHYRSKSKHQLKIFSIQSDILPKPGMKLLNSQNKTEIAELIDYCPLNENTWLVALSIIQNHPESFVFEETASLTHLNAALP